MNSPITSVPSPTRRTVRQSSDLTKLRNYALLQPTAPSISSPSNTRGTAINARNRSTRELFDDQPNRQDSDGAVEKSSTVVFQANRSLLQLINSGEACFFDNLSPYIPTKLARFCFLWLNDDAVTSPRSQDNAKTHSSSYTLVDRSIWVYPTHVELNWKTEIFKASKKWKSSLKIVKKRPTTTSKLPPRFATLINMKHPMRADDQKEMQLHSCKMGFLQFLWYFLGTSQETHLTTAVELFNAMHLVHVVNKVADSLQTPMTFKMPRRHYLSDGRPAVSIYQNTKRHDDDFLNVELLESIGEGPFKVELKVKVQPRTPIDNNCRERNQHRSSSFARNLKFKRPHFYHIDEEDIHGFLFNKIEYSIDEFGHCTEGNAPSGDYENTFFGKIMEGLVFDSEQNALSVDFLDRHKIAKYYKEAVSATEKVVISKVYDERKIEVALRESVSKMAEFDRLNTLPEENVTLTSIYRSFIKEDNVKSNDGVKQSNIDDTIDAEALLLPVYDNVDSIYVKFFNNEIKKKVAIKDKEKAVRMEIFMRRFALVDTTDYTTPEDYHLYDKVPMPLYSIFSTKTSKVLYGLVTRSAPASIAQIREALRTSYSARSLSMKNNVMNMLLRTRGLSEHLTACSFHNLDQIANSCNFIQLPNNGTILAKEGEYFDCCYIVISGSVNIIKWKSKKYVKKQGGGRGDKTLYKRYSTTNVITKGDFIGEDAIRGKHCWTFDVVSAASGTAICLLPLSIIQKHIGKVNSTSRNFIETFWRFNHIWEITMIKHEKEIVEHFFDGLSDKLAHIESSSYFFKDGDANSNVLDTGVELEGLAALGIFSSGGDSSTVPATEEEMQKWLTDRAYVRCYRPGEVIFQQGSESHLLHVVLLGECCLARKLSISTSQSGNQESAKDNLNKSSASIEIDLGLSLFPGHFALEVTEDQLNKVNKGPEPKTYKNENAELHEAYEKWEESIGEKVKRNKNRNTIIDSNRFSYSMVSSTSTVSDARAMVGEILEGDDGEKQYQKRLGIFKKVTLCLNLYRHWL
mmetsp:Transcript_7197/g.12103  ORF Transcript_7197/g.12103 Transcript_7197/m.12103 type:complete len:1027 (-) Transcript_7197:679-3759(-)